MTAGLAERSAAGWVPSAIDVVCDPVLAVAELAVLPASGATVQAVASVDASGFDDAARIDYLIALRKQEAALAAERTRVLASLGREDVVELEVAPALAVSQPVGMTKLHHARFAVAVLPETIDALGRGELSEVHVRILIEATWSRGDDLARAVQDRVLRDAGGLTPGRFRAAVRRALLAADPATDDQRRRRAETERCVRSRPVEDGMVQWWLLLPAAGSAVLEQAIDAVATEMKHPGDGLTGEQRRANALVQIAAGVLADPALLHRQGQHPETSVTISWQALCGLGEDPAHLAGYGPISAGHARALAAAAIRWRIMLTDEAGRIIARSVTTYTPSAGLRSLVIARDQTCTFPGCTARAERCDLDHAHDWRCGGATDAANLHPLCRRHHNAKTSGHWRVERDNTTGATTWTSPTGHTWTTHPPPTPHPPPDPPGGPPPIDTTSDAEPAVLDTSTDDDDPPPF